MKKVFIILSLFLAVQVTAQKTVTVGLGGGSGGSGLSTAEKDSIYALINKKANFDSLAIPFTTEDQLKLDEVASRPNIDSSLIRYKPEKIAPSDLLNTTVLNIDALGEYNVASYRALGSRIIATPISVTWTGSTTVQALVDGSQRFAGTLILKEDTATGIHFYIETQGVYNADNNNKIALYRKSNDSLIYVAQSANDTAMWKQPVGNYFVPFVGGPVILKPGIYYTTVLWNAATTTTTPAIKATSALAGENNTMDFPNGVKIIGHKSAADVHTDFSYSTLSSNGNRYMINLYK